jgi:xanthine dehydrogenase accessory factor
MTVHVDVMDIMSRMRAADESFAVATVVRTVSVTAAKAGAKGIIKPDGTIIAGWIGGGCARSAVLRAARQALADGQPRLVSIQPEDLMARGFTRATSATASPSSSTAVRARARWISSSSRCCRGRRS